MKTPYQQVELEFTPVLPEPRELGIHARFVKFHANNPEVYNNLVRLARDFRRRGHNHNRKMGIACLFEVLRWNYYMNVDMGEEEFKLSNDFRAPYARLIMQQEPDLQDAFNIKTSVVD
jgi:hypothetical protein